MIKIKQFLKNNLKPKSVKQGAYTGAVTALVLACAVGINLIATSIPSQYTMLDFTENNIFSLSENTQQIAQNLNQKVNIYYVTTPELQDIGVGSLLLKYEDISSKIDVTYIDPVANPTFSTKYDAAMEIGSLVIESETQRVRVISPGEMYSQITDEVTLEVSDLFLGEVKITSALQYVTSEDLPKMYITEAHAEMEMPTGYTAQLADANIITQNINLLTVSEIPQDCDVLLINAPVTDISSTEANIIENYLSEGGSLIVVTNFGEYNTDDTPMPNLEKILSSYGMSEIQGIVFEADTSYHFNEFSHYLLPEVVPHEITQPIADNYIAVPWAHAIQISENTPEDVNVYPLLSTTNTAYIKEDAFASDTVDIEEGDLQGSFIVAAYAENVQNNSKLAWLPTTGFVDDQTDALVSGSNRALFLSIIMHCTNHEIQTVIQAKPLEFETLVVPQSFTGVFSFVYTILIPITLLLIGFAIWLSRRRT